MAKKINLGKVVVGVPSYKTMQDLIEASRDKKHSLSLTVGKVIELEGYYTAGDGAGHKRVIASEDDGSGVQLSNGLWANIVHNGIVHSNWFGANKSGDITDIFKKIVAYNKPTIIDYGTYNLTEHIFDDNNVIVENLGTFNNKKIIRTLPLQNEKSNFSLIEALTKEAQPEVEFNSLQCICYNDVRNEYVISRATTSSSTLSTLYVFDSNMKFLRKKELPLDHASQIAFKKSTNEYIVAYDWGYTGVDKNKYVAILDADTLEFKKDELIGSVTNSLYYDNDLDILATSGWEGFRIFDKDFNLLKTILVKNNPTDDVIYQGTAFINGMLMYLFCDKYYKNAIIRYFNLKGELIRQDRYYFDDGLECEGLSFLQNGNLLSLSYSGSVVKIYEIDLNKHSHNAEDIVLVKNEQTYYVNSQAIYEGDGTRNKPFKTLNRAILELSLKRVDSVTLITEGEFNESIGIVGFGKFRINGQGKTVLNGSISATSIGWLWLDGFNINVVSTNGLALYLTACGISTGNITINSDGDTSGGLYTKRCVCLYNCVGNIDSTTINNANTPFYITQGSIIRFHTIKGTGNGYGFFVEGGIIMITNVTSFQNTKGNYKSGNGQIFGETTATSLDTPYYTYKMEQEGVLQDYYSYLDEKYAYDAQVQAEEQARYEAYELALQDNPELTWEEFETQYSPTMSLEEKLKEPVIPESVKKFMEKYL